MYGVETIICCILSILKIIYDVCEISQFIPKCQHLLEMFLLVIMSHIMNNDSLLLSLAKE